MAAAQLLLHLLNAACLEYQALPGRRGREGGGEEKIREEEFSEGGREGEKGLLTEEDILYKE